MHRFFVDEIGETAVIGGEDFMHLARVLRLKAGDTVELCDGRGMDYEARIESVAKDAALCRVLSSCPSRTEPACRVTLFQALPKAGKLETVIQKCTELGVCAITPVISRYCVAEPGNFDKKLLRLRRVAYEAAKQSRRGRVPQVNAPVALSALCPADFDSMLVAYENEHELTLKRALKTAAVERAAGIGSAAIVVGPEGGFDPAEVEALCARGAQAVSLGARILRTETAGPAMLAQLLYELEI